MAEIYPAIINIGRKQGYKQLREMQKVKEMLDAERNSVGDETYICCVVGFSCLRTVLRRLTVKVHCVQKQLEILVSFLDLYCVWQ